MKTKFYLLTLTIIFLILLFPSVIFAYSQVLGKKDAKGQIKKQEVEVNVGRIEEVKPEKIIVKTKDKNIEVNTNKNTKIVEKPSGKQINQGQLKKDAQIATFEKKKEQATGSADLVIVNQATSSASLQQKRRAVYGVVRTITGNNIIVSHPIKDNPRYTLQVTDSTYIKIKGLASATISDIKIGDRITGVGNWDGNILVVKKIHIIPGKAIGLMQKVATDSASTAATSSAVPTIQPSIFPSPIISPINSPTLGL